MPKRVLLAHNTAKAKPAGSLPNQSYMYTHTLTHTHSRISPQGGADSGSLQKGKWPDNKDAQLAWAEWTCCLRSCSALVWIKSHFTPFFYCQTEMKLKYGFFSDCLKVHFEGSIIHGKISIKCNFLKIWTHPCLLFLARNHGSKTKVKTSSGLRLKLLYGSLNVKECGQYFLR